MTQEEQALQQLREILLQSDRQKVTTIEETLDSPEKLEEKMRPIMNKQVAYLRDNFRDEFGGTVNSMVESKTGTIQGTIIGCDLSSFGADD